MKFFVLTKRRLTMLAVFLVGCAAVGMATGLGIKRSRAEPTAVVQTASIQRKVPIYSVATDEKKIAISFDAAWGNEQTQELIDILARYNVKTTFFVVGDWAEKFPESVKALHDAGHEVCNHSNTHPHMPTLSRSQQTEELLSCNDNGRNSNSVPTTLRRLQQRGSGLCQKLRNANHSMGCRQLRLERSHRRANGGTSYLSCAKRLDCFISQRRNQHPGCPADHFRAAAKRWLHHCSHLGTGIERQLHH